MPNGVGSMMMCDECGVRPANIHLTTIVGGEKKELNLCSECLARKKEFHLDFSAIASRINGLLHAQTEETGGPDIRCPRCGTTYDQFRKTGQLGCAQCYDAFREPLGSWMEKTQGSCHHIGRESGGVDYSVSLRIKLDKLRRLQQTAIAREDYETAARLRDQIRGLTAEMEAERHD